MNFSLKTFLIVLCVGGAFVGIMGKLLLESPESFLAALWFEATVVPFLLATGTLIAVGLRSRSRKLAWWGLVLMLLPAFVYFGQAMFIPSGNPIQLLSTRRLIERRLPKQVDEPWVWQELKRRMDSNSLAREDAQDAVDTLIEHMKTTRPGGWNQSLSWQKDFLSVAIARGLVTDEQLFDLCDAFFGAQPTVRPITPAVAGQTGVQVDLSFGNPWVRNSGLGTELLWDVKRVELDGSPMKITQPARFSNNWNAYCEGPLTAGDHELKIEVECAYVDESVAGANNPAAKAPPSQWPKAKKRWTTTVTAPLKVSGTGDK